MSEENIEIARAAIEAAIRRPKPDYETMNALFHPDHEYLSHFRMVEGGSRRGARGYREWATNTAKAVE